jgi:hypothetical protein
MTEGAAIHRCATRCTAPHLRRRARIRRRHAETEIPQGCRNRSNPA